MVANMGLPLTFGEDHRFVHFMHEYTQPAFRRIPRTISCNNIIKSYKNNKHLIIQEFNNHSGIIFVTSYIWTNQNNDLFTCVTTHYIDSNWKLQKKILGFRIIYHPHDGPTIYDFITSVFKEFDIQSKIFSITFDNVLNNTSVINLFVRTN